MSIWVNKPPKSGEFFTITTETAHAINTSKKRRLAVGTTTARTLESSHHGQTIIPQNGSTCLFIYPPYEITTFDMLLTNFHLPRSSLLMLVAAFCGKDFLFEAYALALAKRFRFYSFGDAMLIV